MPDLLLDSDSLPKLPKSPGDLGALQTGLASHLAKLEAQLLRVEEPVFVFVTGHPGTGKSTLIRALEALELPRLLFTFHVDDHVDWVKVVKFVDECEALGPADYVPEANRAALRLACQLAKDRRLIILEGTGLIGDYMRICAEERIPTPFFVVLDADPATIASRLSKRKDAFRVTEKEQSEHKQNLTDMERFKGLRLNTDRMDRDRPIAELRELLCYVSDMLALRVR